MGNTDIWVKGGADMEKKKAGIEISGKLTLESQADFFLFY